MHAFGLTFRQDKVDSMHYVFVLEPYVLVCFLLVLLIFYLRKKPRLLMGCLSIYSTLFKSPLDRLIEFSSLLQSKSVLSGNAGVRQMLAHEVELAEMRREEERARERDALRLGEKAVLERESVKRNAPEGAARQDNPNGDSSSGMKDKGKMDKVKRDVDLTNLMAAGKERLLKKQVKRNCMNMVSEMILCVWNEIVFSLLQDAWLCLKQKSRNPCNPFRTSFMRDRQTLFVERYSWRMYVLMSLRNKK